MPAARFQIHHDGTALLQYKQVLGHAGLAGADCSHDVPACRRAVRRQVAEDLVPRSVAKGRDGGLDVG